MSSHALSLVTTIFRVVTCTLCVIVAATLVVELIALWESCRAKQQGNAQARRFQYLFLFQTLANSLLLMFFTMEAFYAVDHTRISCELLTKLMGVVYTFVYVLFFVFLFMRVNVTGRHYFSTRVRILMRLTETFGYIFMPIILFPALFSPANTALQPTPDQCLLYLPVYTLVPISVITPTITMIVIGLFIYPLLHSARSSQEMNRRAARKLRSTARFNAIVSLVGLMASTITIITFCVLTSLAKGDRAYLLLIAHSLALIDAIFIGFCSRVTLHVWLPSPLAKRFVEVISRHFIDSDEGSNASFLFRESSRDVATTTTTFRSYGYVSGTSRAAKSRDAGIIGLDRKARKLPPSEVTEPVDTPLTQVRGISEAEPNDGGKNLSRGAIQHKDTSDEDRRAQGEAQVQPVEKDDMAIELV